MRAIALIFVLALGLNAEPIRNVETCKNQTGFTTKLCRAIVVNNAFKDLPEETKSDHEVMCRAVRLILTTYLALSPSEITTAQSFGIYRDLSAVPELYEFTLRCARIGKYDD